MSTSEFSSIRPGNGGRVPLTGELMAIQRLWQSQLPLLHRSGVLDQAISWAEHDGSFLVDPVRSHVFVEVSPTAMPWDGEVPDGCIALNGIMLSGIRRDAGRHAAIEHEVVPVHIGMYFVDEFRPDTGEPAFGNGSLAEPPQTVIGDFEPLYGEVVHEQALTVHWEATLFDLPLDDRLSLPPRLLNQAFANPMSPL